MLEVCSGVTNEKEKDGVYKRSSRLWSGLVPVADDAESVLV